MSLNFEKILDILTPTSNITEFCKERKSLTYETMMVLDPNMDSKCEKFGGSKSSLSNTVHTKVLRALMYVL